VTNRPCRYSFEQDYVWSYTFFLEFVHRLEIEIYRKRVFWENVPVYAFRRIQQNEVVFVKYRMAEAVTMSAAHYKFRSESMRLNFLPSFNRSRLYLTV
jgi:hypothetical protein